MTCRAMKDSAPRFTWSQSQQVGPVATRHQGPETDVFGPSASGNWQLVIWPCLHQCKPDYALFKVLATADDQAAIRR
jgi:hypothetical protein